MARMQTRDQVISLWMLPVFGVMVVIAIGVYAGYLPPMSPAMTADQVATFYREHTASLRTGMIIFNVCGAMIVPFFVVIAVQMQRMRLSSSALSYAYLMCVAAGTGLYLLADLSWLVAAFRADRDPQVVMLLNDFGWFSFVTPVGVVMVQLLVLGLAILLDQRPDPVFPRWAGAFNIVAGLLFLPSAFAVVYKTGPFAWDGVLAFWLKLAVFAVYLAVMFFVVRAAIQRQQQEERQPA
jgi:hypothetical protein